MFSLYGIGVLIVLGTGSAQATTYYVASTGNDSNPGTSIQPWRHPQKCVDSGSPLIAGDTCIVRSGTYTDTGTDGITIWIRGNSPAGTATKPITLKSEIPYGAIIQVPHTHTNSNTAIHINAAYWMVEGFDIDGSLSTDPTNHVGIRLANASNGTVIRNNRIHHIGRSCNDTHNDSGNVQHVNAGILVTGQSDVLIQENVIYTIGRYRNDENGCSTSIYQHDHGIYAAGTNLTIRRNVIFDANRGYPIHIYGGTTTNLQIYHNTLSGRSATGYPKGQIRLASTINQARIMNNLSHNSSGGLVNAFPLKGLDVVVSHNMGDSSMNIWGMPIPGVTFSDNFEQHANLSLADPSRYDFRLTEKSVAIDRGTTIGVPQVKDGAPDIGAFEFAGAGPDKQLLAPVELKVQ